MQHYDPQKQQAACSLLKKKSNPTLSFFCCVKYSLGAGWHGWGNMEEGDMNYPP